MLPALARASRPNRLLLAASSPRLPRRCSPAHASSSPRRGLATPAAAGSPEAVGGQGGQATGGTELYKTGSSTKEKKKLVLLDFLPLVYKSYFASIYFDMSMPFEQVYGETGGGIGSDYAALGGVAKAPLVPLSTVFFFAKTLVQLVQALEHDAIVCARDGSTNDRKVVYPAYKESRTPMPQELKQQIPLCLEMLQSVGIPVIAEAGVEADDLLATVARHVAVERGDWEAVVVSPDKDLLQMVTEDGSITMYNAKKQQHVDYRGAIEHFGVPPELIPQVQCLSGDRVDNIPGVPGVGVKTAAKLINEHGSFEAVVAAAQAGGLTPKLRSNVIAEADMLPVYHQLVTLRLDAKEGLPPKFLVDEVPTPDLDARPFRDMLQRLNFRSVARSVEKRQLQLLLEQQRAEADEVQRQQQPPTVEEHSLDDEFFFNPAPPEAVVQTTAPADDGGGPGGAVAVKEEDSFVFK